MKNLKVFAATLTLLVSASGAALAQPKQHDRGDERRAANMTFVSNHSDHDGNSRVSEMSYGQTRADCDGWNSGFVNARSRQDDLRGRDEDAGSQYRAAESRRDDERLQQTREVHARRMHPVRPGTSDRDRF